MFFNVFHLLYVNTSNWGLHERPFCVAGQLLGVVDWFQGRGAKEGLTKCRTSKSEDYVFNSSPSVDLSMISVSFEYDLSMILMGFCMIWIDLAEFLQVSFPQFSALDDRTVCGWFPGEGINCQTMTGIAVHCGKSLCRHATDISCWDV